MATSIYQDEPSDDLQPIAIGAAQAAKLLGISESTLRKLVKANEIPHKYVRGRLLFSVEELKKWVANPES